jgi:hypothetical protein
MMLAREAGILEDGEIADKQANRFINQLVAGADWTSMAASELVCLARRYGVFRRRNALGLPVAIGIDDGEGGF